MKRRFFDIALAICSIFAPFATYAQAPCAPHPIISQHLIEDGMVLVSRPLVDMRNGSMGQAEIWAGGDGDWIMIAVSPGGLACAAMAGVGWGIGERT